MEDYKLEFDQYQVGKEFIKEENMKKLLTAGFIALVLLSGCSKQAEATQTLANDMHYVFDDVLSSSVGQIFVM